MVVFAAGAMLDFIRLWRASRWSWLVYWHELRGDCRMHVLERRLCDLLRIKP